MRQYNGLQPGHQFRVTKTPYMQFKKKFHKTYVQINVFFQRVTIHSEYSLIQHILIQIKLNLRRHKNELLFHIRHPESYDIC